MYVADMSGEVVYTVMKDKVYEGKGTDGRVVYILDGAKIREGDQFWSPVVGIWQGDDLIVTNGVVGTLLYRLVGNKIIYVPRGWEIYRLL